VLAANSAELQAVNAKDCGGVADAGASVARALEGISGGAKSLIA